MLRQHDFNYEALDDIIKFLENKFSYNVYHHTWKYLDRRQYEYPEQVKEYKTKLWELRRKNTENRRGMW